MRAWVTAIRRDQSPARAHIGLVEWDEKFGLIKINPLATWSARDVWNYIAKHDVPYNPLHDQGYPSIGCVPCTTPVQIGETPRAGRWRGTGKSECGIHEGSSEWSVVSAGHWSLVFDVSRSCRSSTELR